MNCFICGKEIEENIDHNEKDHRVWFSLRSLSFAFTSIDLFDDIYYEKGEFNYCFWSSYILYSAKTNKLEKTIYKDNNRIVTDYLYWKDFKELKSYINKIMVFQ